MTFNPIPWSASPADKRRQHRLDRDALEQELRQPSPPTDEAFCAQIMETVRQADRPPGPVEDGRPTTPGILSWAGASAALGVAAVVALLVWMPPRPGGSEPTSPVVSAATHEPDFLASDTRQIATFLRDNLRL